MSHRYFILVLTLLGIISFDVLADLQHFHEYQYDAAGNIVRIKSITQSDAPHIISINPGFINIGRKLTLTATGTDLMAAEVTTTATGLVISNVETTQTQVTFFLEAHPDAMLGTAVITFTTLFGSESVEIVVAEAVPDLLSRPSPIVIAANNQPSTVEIFFSEPRLTQETYTLSTIDPLIAVASNTTFTIAKGASKAEFQLTGLISGSTILNIVLAEKFFSFKFQVFVGEVFFGQSHVSAPAIGLYLKPIDTLPFETKLDSKRVGILLAPENNNVSTSLSAHDVGILMQIESTSFQQKARSSTIGIVVDSENNPHYLPFLLSPNVGIYLEEESLLSQVTTHSTTVGIFVTSGSNDIHAPIFSPGLGIYLDTDKTFFEQKISQPEIGILVSSEKHSLNSMILSSLVGIFSGPIITQYEPVHIQKGVQSNIVINGVNLNEITDITIDPTGFITVTDFFIAPDGNSVSINVNTDLSAPSGDYQLLITTPYGELLLEQNTKLTLTIP